MAKSKILIVDDETDQEELMVLTFGYKEFMVNHEFVFAPNGFQALDVLHKHQNVDIALIDINMPDMDGLTLLYKIRDLYPLVQAVMISAYSDMPNIRQAMNHGAFDFITKPIDMLDLEKTLRKTIRHAEEVRTNARIYRENQELRAKSMELEMQALRAQMNPHFIFNSLNSIHNFIQINDKINASDYLLRFSKLIRLILENSARTSISLADELAALKLYIELEALRFSNRFHWEIMVSEDIDIQSVKIPPLIIQPFIENAIKHGLMPLTSEGKLSIYLSQEEETLRVVISDNGIGRKHAAMLNSQNHNHHSMGIGITQDRIRLHNLKQQREVSSKIEIEDLTENESPRGTKVTVQFPLTL